MDNVENTKRKGADSVKTTPKDTTKKIKFTDNSAQNQRLKLLDYLLEHNSITTSEAREKLDIMSPAARILELKAKGYLITTLPANWVSDYGINHKGVARYVLTQKQPVETIKNSGVM